MLAVFRKRRTRRRVPSRPATMRLRLEGLESRLCPSGTQPAVTVQATVLPNHQVQLSGSVADNNPAGIAVNFSGAVQGSTTTGDSGAYSYITSTATLASVTVVAVDQSNVSSTPTSATVAVAAPTITLSVASVSASRTVTVTGQVTGSDASAQFVALTGVVSGAAVPNANGTFSFTAQASSAGTVSATTTDDWGQTSSVTQATAQSPAPTITSFTGFQVSSGMWTFQGQVNAPNPGGLTVVLGVLVKGATVTTQPSGWFTITLPLNVIASGTVTAQTTDAWGQQSNVACFFISLNGDNN